MPRRRRAGSVTGAASTGVPDEWCRRMRRTFACQAFAGRTLACRERRRPAGPAAAHRARPRPARRRPVPYRSASAPPATPRLDQLLHDASTLIALRATAPVGPFALVARARDDRARFAPRCTASATTRARPPSRSTAARSTTPALIDALRGGARRAPAQVAASFDAWQAVPSRHGQPHRQPAAGHGPASASTRGDPARAADILAAGDHLLAALRQAGYALATVAPPGATLHPDQGTLDVAFAVNAGPRVDLGAITISGLKHVHAAYVRNRLTLHPGQLFDPTGDRGRARRPGRARRVLGGPGRAGDAPRRRGPAAADLRGDRAPPRSVDLGLSYATDTGLSPSVGWHHRNLFGNARAAQPDRQRLRRRRRGHRPRLQARRAVHQAGLPGARPVAAGRGRRPAPGPAGV